MSHSPANPRPPLTALIMTLNGERLLDQCLSSLAFCDHILLIDSGSTDATKEIAANHRAEFVFNPWPGPKAQLEFGLARITSGWVLILDQDEICSPRLTESIRAALLDPSAPPCHYAPRRSWYYNRFLTHGGWYPDYLLRLFKAGTAELRQSGAHESIHPLAPAGHLKGDILHYPYENFSNHLQKINAYAQAGARDLQSRNRRGGVAAGLGHAVSRFLRIYVLKLGLLDGRAGFINAAHAAFYTFLKYVRINEGDWGAPYTLPDQDNTARKSQ